MPNLFPIGYEDEVILAEDIKKEDAGYKHGVAFENGDFVRDGKNKIQDANGIESWKSWCINCLQTERYKHLAYSTDFGIELDAVFAARSREEAESILTRQITEAILADPYERAQYIESIEYTWDGPDAVEVRISIHGIENVSIDTAIKMTRGGEQNARIQYPWIS